MPKYSFFKDIDRDFVFLNIQKNTYFGVSGIVDSTAVNVNVIESAS
jgi:hypothetical protein